MIVLSKVIIDKRKRSVVLEKVDDLLGAETSVHITNS